MWFNWETSEHKPWLGGRIVGDEFAAERIFANKANDGNLSCKNESPGRPPATSSDRRGAMLTFAAVIQWLSMAFNGFQRLSMIFYHLKVMLIVTMWTSLAYVATSLVLPHQQAVTRRAMCHCKLSSNFLCSLPKTSMRSLTSSSAVPSEKQKTPAKLVESISHRIHTNIQQMGALENIQSQLEKLELLSSENTFWDDANRAHKVVLDINRLRSLLTMSSMWKRNLEEMELLLELIDSDNEEESFLFTDLEDIFKRTSKSLDEFEVQNLLSDKYDDHNCLLSIQCGLGGEDAQEWVSMLSRMYKRLAERRGWRVIVLDESTTDVGLKSIELKIEGSFAYGLLRGEKGTHRLVRISPFNALGKRQTSFAGVETYPELEESESSSIAIADKVSLL